MDESKPPGDASPARWEVLRREVAAESPVFRVMRHRCRHPRRNVESDFIVLDSFNWAVTLAITPEGEMVMVRQFRFGIEELTWEMPAGCLDAGEDPVTAGVRELREETGYAGENARLIGTAHPNPALANNTAYFVLVENARRVDDGQPDTHEELETRTVPVEDVYVWARTGVISHAIVMSALFYFQPERERLGC